MLGQGYDLGHDQTGRNLNLRKEQQTQSSRRYGQDNEREVQRTERQKDYQPETMDFKQRQMKEANDRTEYMKKKLKGYRSKLRMQQKNVITLEAEYQSHLDEELQLASMYIQDLEDEKAEMAKRESDMEEKLQTQEKVIRDLQEDHFRMQNQGEWILEQDSDISDEINSLERAIRDWSKLNAVKTVAQMRLDTLNATEMAALQKSLSNVTNLSSNWLPGGLLDPNMVTISPWLLLSSWLSSIVYSKIVSEPFFYLDSFVRGDEISEAEVDFGKDLRKLTDYLEDCKSPFLNSKCLR
jgi:chromosome segregation ATPase